MFWECRKNEAAYRTNGISYPQHNGGDRMNNIVRVHRPTLTAEEREARMKLIADAAARLVIAAEQSKRELRAKS